MIIGSFHHLQRSWRYSSWKNRVWPLDIIR